MLLGEELGALQVPEQHLGGPAVAVHAHQHVLQVRLQDYAMVEVGGEHGWQQQAQIAGPPVHGLLRSRAVQQSGDVRTRGRVLVGDRGGEQRGGAGQQPGVESLSDDHAEAFQQREVRAAVGTGQGPVVGMPADQRSVVPRASRPLSAPARRPALPHHRYVDPRPWRLHLRAG